MCAPARPRVHHPPCPALRLGSQKIAEAFRARGVLSRKGLLLKACRKPETPPQTHTCTGVCTRTRVEQGGTGLHVRFCLSMVLPVCTSVAHACACAHTHTHFPLHLSLSTHSLKHYFLFTEHVCRVEGAHGLAPERRSLQLPHCPSHPREARPFRVCGTHLSVRLSLPADRKRRCFCPSGKPRLPLAHVHAEMSALLRMGSRLRREQQVSEFLALKEIVYLQ